MKTRWTMQDIAEKLGITKMTVSRYLKDPKSVSKETGLKIAKLIDELGYIAPKAPAMLSKSSSKAIGVIVPSFSNMVFSDVILGVNNKASKEGYSILITHMSYDMLEEAMEKRIASGHDILYLMQDMREFELYGTVRMLHANRNRMNRQDESAYTFNTNNERWFGLWETGKQEHGKRNRVIRLRPRDPGPLRKALRLETTGWQISGKLARRSPFRKRRLCWPASIRVSVQKPILRCRPSWRRSGQAWKSRCCPPFPRGRAWVPVPSLPPPCWAR